MNWFVHRLIKVENKDQLDKKLGKEQYSCCEHVKKDASCAVGSVAECDSFGSDEPYVYCQICKDKMGLELVQCHDCCNEVPEKDTIEWGWFDFDYFQGDRKLVICKECQTKEKHLKRVAKDTADYEAEMKYYNRDY